MTGEPSPPRGTVAESERTEPIHIDDVRTYVHCPRRYQYAVVDGVTDDTVAPRQARFEAVRTALRAAIRAGPVAGLEERAVERLTAAWNRHTEDLHSPAQRAHERRVLEATIRAYAEAVGADHVRQLCETRTGGVGGELVGKDLRVWTMIGASSATDEAQRGPACRLETPLDYAFVENSTLVGVRFIPTPAPLSTLRYEPSWEGRIETAFDEHVDPDTDRFEPDLVATLLETSAVIDGLRRFRDRHDLETVRTCRYMQIPLFDSRAVTVNRIRDEVTTSVNPVDLTTSYLDHHTFGMTLEHRNAVVDRHLQAVLTAIVDGRYDPTDRWDRRKDETCPSCGYTVCCVDHITSEVRFDGR